MNKVYKNLYFVEVFKKEAIATESNFFLCIKLQIFKQTYIICHDLNENAEMWDIGLKI